MNKFTIPGPFTNETPFGDMQSIIGSRCIAVLSEDTRDFSVDEDTD